MPHPLGRPKGAGLEINPCYLWTASHPSGRQEHTSPAWANIGNPQFKLVRYSFGRHLICFRSRSQRAPLGLRESAPCLNRC